jgi:hypothetical protein
LADDSSRAPVGNCFAAKAGNPNPRRPCSPQIPGPLRNRDLRRPDHARQHPKRGSQTSSRRGIIIRPELAFTTSSSATNGGTSRGPEHLHVVGRNVRAGLPERLLGSGRIRVYSIARGGGLRNNAPVWVNNGPNTPDVLTQRADIAAVLNKAFAAVTQE